MSDPGGRGGTASSGIVHAVTGTETEADRSRRQARWKGADWRLIPGTPRPPLTNMALDEVLTLRVGRGERAPTIRVWGWDRSCVVLGRFQSVKNEVNEEAMLANDVELVRRVSGGGAMFIEPEGAITWSIYAPESLVAGMTFQESYEFFDGWVVDALQELGVDAWYQPLNDIASTGGKIGGAAQARRGGAVLHHTTMAYQMNVGLMTRVLRIGQEKLSDKGVTSADKRVGPLRQQTDLPRDVIIEHMIAHFGTQVGLTPDEVSPDELEEAERLVQERFGTKEWIYFLP